MWWLVLAALGSGPPPKDPRLDPALLAPGPNELARALAEARDQVADAAALGVAVARVQNRMAEALAAGADVKSCPAELRRMAAVSTRLILAERDAAQSARIAVGRAQRIVGAPTVTPVLDPRQRAELADLVSSATILATRHLEAAAWFRRHIQPIARRCGDQLEVGPGYPSRLPARSPRVAVLGIGEGRICPNDVPATEPWIITLGKACYGAAGCDCRPASVDPGAVLGPPPD